jgi:hypothetical protein
MLRHLHQGPEVHLSISSCKPSRTEPFTCCPISFRRSATACADTSIESRHLYWGLKVDQSFATRDHRCACTLVPIRTSGTSDSSTSGAPCKSARSAYICYYVVMLDDVVMALQLNTATGGPPDGTIRGSNWRIKEPTGSRSNEKAGKQPPGESNDNLHAAYRNTLWLAYTRARSNSRLASPLVALFQVFVVSKIPHVQFCFPAFAVDREHGSVDEKQVPIHPSGPETDLQTWYACSEPYAWATSSMCDVRTS